MGDPPYDSRAVANLILRVRKDMNCFETTQIELHKLLYFSHGKYLFSEKKPLVTGFFEAWKHGPVHPAVYRSFKSFGSGAITTEAQRLNISTGERSEIEIPHNHAVRRHIFETVASLTRYSASQLRALSHAKNGPWWEIVQKSRNGVALGLRIPDSVIIERFKHHTLPMTLDPEYEEEIRENSRFASD